jgi:hypothetical protein
MTAIWNGTVGAESNETVTVERSHYFPREVHGNQKSAWADGAHFGYENPEHR